MKNTTKKEKVTKTRAKKVKEIPAPAQETLPKIIGLGHKSIGQLVFEKHGTRDLSDIFGEKTGNYEWATEDEYESHLNDMNMTDLENHAISLGIKPKSDRDLLTRNLLRLFRSDASALAGAPVGNVMGQPGLTKEMAKFLSGE